MREIHGAQREQAETPREKAQSNSVRREAGGDGGERGEGGERRANVTNLISIL